MENKGPNVGTTHQIQIQKISNRCIHVHISFYDTNPGADLEGVALLEFVKYQNEHVGPPSPWN
jgi:hypothetical protein